MKFLKFFSGDEWKEFNKFQEISDNERSIVFYAENKASINHFKLLISELTEKMDMQVCYVTSVKNDPYLCKKNKNIHSFYIGDGIVRTKFFLTLKAKILIMDMPDLNTFHIKKSKVFPVHYVYLFHSIFSIHSYLRKGAVDNYDTIFCVGPHHMKEILETEKIYGLKPKKLIEYGYGRLDTLIQEKDNFKKTDYSDLIIITPTYGKNNLLEICGIELIEILLKFNFKVLLRPHFRILRDSPKLINKIIKKFEKNNNFIFEEGIISKESFHNSKCLISDWSGISFEYAFTFKRPVIFIDVPQKILNENYKDISFEPIEFSIRSKIGKIFSPNDLEEIPIFLKNNSYMSSDEIEKICNETIYNIGKSAKIGAEYIKELNNQLKNCQ